MALYFKLFLEQSKYKHRTCVFLKITMLKLSLNIKFGEPKYLISLINKLYANSEVDNNTILNLISSLILLIFIINILAPVQLLTFNLGNN